jgi:hypothetical protein
MPAMSGPAKASSSEIAELAGSAGYGRRGGRPPRRRFRTGRESFPLIRLLSTRASVTGTPLGTITHPRSLASAHSEWNFRSAFTTPLSVCPRPFTLSAPMPSRVPALRLHIPGITLGLRFLGHPTPSGLAAWSPAPASPERAPDGFPRSVCPFYVTLGRHSTPCPTIRVDTTST